MGVGGQRLRREPGGERAHFVGREALRDLRHAVGRVRVAQAGLPGAELADQVVARQAEQAGDGGQHAGERVAVAGCAGGQLARRVAAPDQRLAARELLARRVDGLRRRVGQIQAGEMPGDVAQVGVGQVVEQIGHAGVLAPTVAEVGELVVQIVGRFARYAREIAAVGGAALFAVAQGAGHKALGQGVGHGTKRLGGGRRTLPEQGREADGYEGSKVDHGREESTTAPGPIH